MLAVTLLLSGCMTIDVQGQTPSEKEASRTVRPVGAAGPDSPPAVASGAVRPAAPDSPPARPSDTAPPVVVQTPAKVGTREIAAGKQRPGADDTAGPSPQLPDAQPPAPLEPSAQQQSGLPTDFGARATEVALGMLGRPYRLGGITPDGFDCSGLLYYSYGQLGVSVPRDTQSLRDITNAIPDSLRRIGDLVFFHIRGRQFSHVGLYVGEGRFLHAPASGGAVRIEKLSVGYWLKRYAGTRRLHFAPPRLERY